MKRKATLQHMFTLLLSLAIMAGSAFSALGQGTETFDNLELSGTSYADGSFTGQDGSTWTYVQSRGDFEITGKAIMLGRNRTPQAYVSSGTISGGIGVLIFDYVQAYSTAVNLNVLVNDNVVGNVTTSDEQGTVKNSGNITIDVEGDFVIKFINADNSDGQVVIDNISWTAPGVVPGDPPVIGSVTRTPEDEISTDVSVSVSAEVTEGTATLSNVELQWGTDSGNYPNTINMTKGSGNTYTTDTDIPTQSDGTTVYYIVYAEDEDGKSDTSAEYDYFVVALSEWDGFETFDNLDLSGTSYSDGSFTGQDGSTWTYVQSRGDFAITEKALMLGRNRSPQAYLLSGTLTGGIGIINFDYMQAYSTDVNLNVMVNDVVAGNVTSSDEQGVVKASGDIVVNVAGPFELKFINANNSDGQVVIDNIRWKNYTTDGNIPPVITNITHSPSADITSSTTVSISADVSDTDGTVEQVELRWGTTAGNYSNTIAMNAGSGDTYNTLTDIPAQTNGITVHYVIYAEDDEGDSTVSGERSYTVQDPLTTSLPYNNTFDSRLGEVYVYSASGSTRSWVHRTASENGYAEMNGFNTGDVEEDWLILPGINMNDYETVQMTFDTYWQYGENDENNYLKLFYSTDYAGIGNTAEATWHELNFTQSSTAQLWTESGQVDLSGLSGEQVFVAFKYRYETGKYRLWRVDNISLAEEAQPVLSAMPSHISQYTYEVGQGPSDIYVFTLSGANLDGSNVSLTAPESFEIALSDQVFGSNLTLDAYDGSDTNILTRLKAGLNAGNYIDEQLLISGGGAEDIHITLSGVVTEPAPPPPGLPYTQNFETFLFESGTEIPHFGADQEWTFQSSGNQLTYQGDWGTGFSAGFRGNSNLMGYQHTSSTGLFVATLTLENDTEETITSLDIAYTGKVERASEGRSPAWTVMVNDTEASALYYSTEDGVDKNISATIDGLNILPGEVFSISWGSERGGPAGSSRQIGITDVSVEVKEPLVLPYYNPLRTEDDNTAALADGFSIHEATQTTSAGGYLRIFPDGYIQSPPILLAELGKLTISFDAQTYGGTTGQTLTVKLSDDGGNSFSDIQAYEIPGSYETLEKEIDLQTYTSESVILRVEMTAGTNSTRLRELHMYDPLAEYMVGFTVTDGEDPIAGATITIGEDSQTTNAEGMAEFSLPNGTYTYAVTAEGYDDIADVQLAVNNDDVSETVVMTRSTYTITASAGDNGSIDPSGEVSVNHGDDQVFIVNPNENYHIAFIKVDGSDINMETDNSWNAANRQYTFSNVTEHHSIEAGFAINTYIIEASAGDNGSIDPSGEISVNLGDDQVFTVNPNQGYRIAFVSVDGSNINLGSDSNWNAGNRQYTFSNVTQNYTIQAGFEVDDTGLTPAGLAELKLFPNPVAGMLYVESTDYITRLDIIDMTGRLVYREEPLAQQLSIDTGALYNGIYFVRVITRTGMTTKRIQVAR